MAASGAHVDISSITFTYGVTPTVLNLGDAESADLTSKGTRIAKSGGNAPGDTHQKIVNQQRSVKLMGFDVAAFAAIPVGVEGTLAFTINDEHNGEGIGALDVELKNCMIDGSEVNAKHNEYATDGVTFTSRWVKESGAFVDPLVITAVTS
jgi:hypothetical protein